MTPNTKFYRVRHRTIKSQWSRGGQDLNPKRIWVPEHRAKIWNTLSSVKNHFAYRQNERMGRESWRAYCTDAVIVEFKIVGVREDGSLIMSQTEIEHGYYR